MRRENSEQELSVLNQISMSYPTDPNKYPEGARGPQRGQQWDSGGGQGRPRQPKDPDGFNETRERRRSTSNYRGEKPWMKKVDMNRVAADLQRLLGVVSQYEKDQQKSGTNQQSSKGQQSNRGQAQSYAQGSSNRNNNRNDYYGKKQHSQDQRARQRDEERKQGNYRQPARSSGRPDQRLTWAPKDTEAKRQQVTTGGQLPKAVPTSLLARGASAHKDHQGLCPSTLPMGAQQNPLRGENPKGQGKVNHNGQSQIEEFDPKGDPKLLVQNLASAAQSKITFEQVEKGLDYHRQFMGQPEEPQYVMEQDADDKDLQWMTIGPSDPEGAILKDKGGPQRKVGVKTRYPPAKLKQQVFGMLKQYSPETFSLFKDGKLSVKMPEEKKYTYKALYTTPVDPDLVQPMQVQLDAMLQAGYVRHPEKDEIAYFQVPLKPTLKENGALRLVCDARELNEFCSAPTAEMPTPLTPLGQFDNRWYTKIDIKEAYMHVELDKDFQRWFGFTFNGKEYFMCRMGFGWCMATYIFQQIMNAVSKEINKRWGDDVKNNPYHDDALMVGHNQHRFADKSTEAKNFYIECGFELNLEKSKLVPCQSMDWIGFHYHSDGVSISTKSKEKILATYKKFMQDGTYGSLISLLGLLNWAATIQLEQRPLLSIIMRKINPYIRINPLKYGMTVDTQTELVTALNQYLQRVVDRAVKRQAFVPTIHHSTFCFFVDATPNMFGYASPMTSAKFQMESFKGGDCHINQHELEALAQIVAASPDQVNLMIYSDSNTVVESISRGTSTSDKLCHVLLDIFKMLADKEVSLIVRYINTKDNPADEPSRRMLPKDRKCLLEDMFIPCRMRAHSFTWAHYLDFITKNTANKAQPKITTLLLAILANAKLGVQLILRYPKKVLETDYFYEGYPPVILVRAYKGFLIYKHKSRGTIKQWPLIKQIGQRLVEGGFMTPEELRQTPPKDYMQQPLNRRAMEGTPDGIPPERAAQINEKWRGVDRPYREPYREAVPQGLKAPLGDPSGEVPQEDEEDAKKQFFGLASNDDYRPDGKPPDDEGDPDDYYDGRGGDGGAYQPKNHPALKPYLGRNDLGLGQRMHEVSNSSEAKDAEIYKLRAHVEQLGQRLNQQEEEIIELEERLRQPDQFIITDPGSRWGNEQLATQHKANVEKIQQMESHIKDLQANLKGATTLNMAAKEDSIKARKMANRLERLEGKSISLIDLDTMPERPRPVPANEVEASLLEEIQTLKFNHETELKELDHKQHLQLDNLIKNHENQSQADRQGRLDEVQSLMEEYKKEIADLKVDFAKTIKDINQIWEKKAEAQAGEAKRLQELLNQEKDEHLDSKKALQLSQDKHSRLVSAVGQVASLVDCKKGNDPVLQMQDSQLAIAKLNVDRQEFQSQASLFKSKYNDSSSHITALKEEVTMIKNRETQEKSRYTMELDSKTKLAAMAEERNHALSTRIIELQDTLSKVQFEHADQSTDTAQAEAEKLRAQVRDIQVKASKDLEELNQKLFDFQQEALGKDRKVQELENTLRMEKEATKAASDKNIATNKTLQEVQKKLASSDETSTKFSSEIQTLKLKQGDFTNQVKDLNSKLGNTTQRYEELQLKLSATQEDLNSAKGTILTTQMKLASEQTKVSTLTERCNQLYEFSNELVKSVKRGQDQITDLSLRIYRGTHELQTKNQLLDAHITHETDLTSIIDALAPETLRLDHQMARISLELSTANLQLQRTMGNWVLQYQIRMRLENHWHQRERDFLEYDAYVQAFVQQVLFFFAQLKTNHEGYVYIDNVQYTEHQRYLTEKDWGIKKSKPRQIAIEQEPLPDIKPPEKEFVDVPSWQIRDPRLGGAKDIKQNVVLKTILENEDAVMWAEQFEDTEPSPYGTSCPLQEGEVIVTKKKKGSKKANFSAGTTPVKTATTPKAGSGKKVRLLVETPFEAPDDYGIEDTRSHRERKARD